ncbi:MAG: hypothetical protein NPIRA02_22210 [Nitrospirales bacterium]|nr:MAG: hypothetical protein NPIRA02_22210 [Nitrospirales bacterium]
MLVGALPATLSSALSDIPTGVFGHSVGALIGFELATSLHECHVVKPCHLFFSSCVAPDVISHAAWLHRLPDPELMDALRKMNGTPEDVLRNRELMILLLPALRADFEKSETYSYREIPPLNCPITLFGGRWGPDVSLSQLTNWAPQTSTGCDTYILDGDHFFLHTARGHLLTIVAEKLTPDPKKIVRDKDS